MIAGDRSTRISVVSALVAVQVFFGLHYTAARFIMDYMPPRAWATLRIGLASVLLMAFVAATRRSQLPRAPRDLAAIAFFSLFGVTINQICFVEGLARTQTAHSAIINTGIPVTTLLIAILMRRERATGSRLAGIALSFSGVLYLILHGSATMRGGVVTGDLLTVANGLSFSFFLVISKPILARHSSLAVTAELLLFGAIGVTLVGGPQLAQVDLAALPAMVWWVIAFVVLFATVAAYMLNAWALKRVDSSVVAHFIYLQPLIAAGTAFALRGEPLGIEVFVAALLIFAGVGVAMARGRRGAAGTGEEEMSGAWPSGER